ncbi:MAG TPA: hypothetical protein VG674_31935 [Amycolatopsis sp.]|nr:hypothetical protein [Amycolatopsis sp.]
MSTPTTQTTADAARTEYERARAEYLDAQDAVLRMGDAVDREDVGWLDGLERVQDAALARWHACAPSAATAWWPGGWRLRGPDGRIQYGMPEKPWFAREDVEDAIRRATPAEVLFRVSTPVWIAVDQADAGPVALDAVYWDERRREDGARAAATVRAHLDVIGRARRADGPAEYDARGETATRWLELARGQLAARIWQPTETEREIAANLAAAITLAPATSHPTMVLELRLLRMAHIPATIRLAMLAGGWGQPAEDDIDPPGPQDRADLAAVLRAVYPLAGMAQRWGDRAAGDRFRQTEAAIMHGEPVTAGMVEGVPDLAVRVLDLESFWERGIGGLSAFLDDVAAGVDA